MTGSTLEREIDGLFGDARAEGIGAGASDPLAIAFAASSGGSADEPPYVDPEMLAAYLAGSLDDGERQRVQDALLASDSAGFEMEPAAHLLSLKVDGATPPASVMTAATALLQPDAPRPEPVKAPWWQFAWASAPRVRGLVVAGTCAALVSIVAIPQISFHPEPASQPPVAADVATAPHDETAGLATASSAAGQSLKTAPPAAALPPPAMVAPPPPSAVASAPPALIVPPPLAAASPPPPPPVAPSAVRPVASGDWEVSQGRAQAKQDDGKRAKAAEPFGAAGLPVAPLGRFAGATANRAARIPIDPNAADRASVLPSPPRSVAGVREFCKQLGVPECLVVGPPAGKCVAVVGEKGTSAFAATSDTLFLSTFVANRECEKRAKTCTTLGSRCAP